MALQLASISAQTQPFVALPEQAPVKDAPAAGVSGRDHTGVGRQLGRGIEPRYVVDLDRDDSAEERANPGGMLSRSFSSSL